MSRLIDADKLKDNINGWYRFMEDINRGYMTLSQADIINKIDAQETVEEPGQEEFLEKIRNIKEYCHGRTCDCCMFGHESNMKNKYYCKIISLVNCLSGTPDQFNIKEIEETIKQ